MLVKCICTNCAGHLEFEEENAGQRITCPHCRFETVLTLPGSETPEPKSNPWLARPVVRKLIGGVLLAAIGIAGVLYVLHRWGVPWIQDEFTSIESTTSAMVFLILACLVLPFLVFWLVFPVVLCLQLRALTKAIRETVSVDSTPGENEDQKAKPASAGSVTPR